MRYNITYKKEPCFRFKKYKSSNKILILIFFLIPIFIFLLVKTKNINAVNNKDEKTEFIKIENQKEYKCEKVLSLIQKNFQNLKFSSSDRFGNIDGKRKNFKEISLLFEGDFAEKEKEITNFIIENGFQKNDNYFYFENSKLLTNLKVEQKVSFFKIQCIEQ